MVYKPVFRTKMCRYGHNCMSKSNCFYFHDGEERRKNSNLTIPIQVHALNKLIDKYQILLNEYQIQILQKLVQKANEFFCSRQLFLYKTKMCHHKKCSKLYCTFAHHPQELRRQNHYFKKLFVESRTNLEIAIIQLEKEKFI